VTTLRVEQSEEWLAGRVHLDTRQLDTVHADQPPQATLEDEQVNTMPA
jgi:hypothetical protein